MKRFLLAGATLLTFAVAQLALAADSPVYRKAPPSAAALFNWTGMYVGLQAGYGWGISNHQQGPTATTNDFRIDGFVGGGTLGWNWQAPGSAIVFGVEGDISWANIKGLHPQPGSGGFGCGTGPCETFVRWFGTARGRVGVAVDRSLIYVTGGWAYGDLFAQITPDPTFTGGQTKSGWTAGFGWEWAFAPNMSLKAEYLYVDFGRFVYGTDPPPPTALAVFSVVRGGVNWRF